MNEPRDGSANVADGPRRLDVLLRAGQARLGSELDAQLLLAAVAGVSRATLLAHGERLLGVAEVQRLHDLVARRAAGEPLAYLLGVREFWSLSLRVTPQVLVPRPETELLVERTLAVLGQRSAHVLELGTGSGAVAIALASERRDWHLTATDVSPQALAVARGNARDLHLDNIDFLGADWYQGLPADGSYDAIVSNPPYIDPADPALTALHAEPALALVAGNDGLAALRAVVEGAPRHLNAGGWLLLEHGAGQRVAVGALLVGRGFARVRSHRDLAGLDRVTEAQWAPRAEPST